MVMDRKPRCRGNGVTLPEVLTAVIILAVIVGSVSAIYAASMRGWYQGASMTYAEQKASWVIQRMVPDIQQALSITPASSPYDTSCIAVQLPARTYDGYSGVYLNQVSTDAEGKPYLVPGNHVVYYRGDEYGNLDVDGDRIWRRLTDPSGGTILKQQEIADNVVDNSDDGTGSPKPMFIYWPDIYRLRSVEVTVTVEETRGHRTATASMTGELTLRNN